MQFSKRTYDQQIVFSLRPNQTIAIDAFTLNMMVDNHLTDEVATKVTVQPETRENAEQLRRIRSAIDKAFAAQGR